MDVDDEGRVHLVSGPAPYDVVWPAGYTAASIRSVAEVRNADGVVVARQGDELELSGGRARPGHPAFRALDPRFPCRVDDSRLVVFVTEVLPRPD